MSDEVKEVAAEVQSHEEQKEVSAGATAVDNQEQIDAKKAKQDAKKEAARLEKAAREAKKAERLAQRQKKTADDQGDFTKDPNDPCADKFGDLDLNMSQCDPEERFQKKYVAVGELCDSHVGQIVRIRGRVHNSRAKGKMAFLVVREGLATVQVVLFVNAGGSELQPPISKGMVNYAAKVCKESIVEIIAAVSKPDKEVAGCSQQVELACHSIWCVNKSLPMLPFQLEDASRLVVDQKAEDGQQLGGPAEEENKDEDKDAKKMPVVRQDVRLNNRVIDLRVPTNQAIMRLQSGVCQIYREYLLSQDFVEIHSPKLIGGTSEGGANVFKLKYFDKDACLAQSPQLYKQMALCGDLQRVFEIGPVFRAEDSNTNRHLCEFTGLDMEMEFKNHYFEVLDVIGDLMTFLFQNIKTRHAKELAVINEQYPFDEFLMVTPPPKLRFTEGVELLREAGYEQDPHDDLDTENEKALGRLVREKYKTDFYILYGYPEAARPFYTMPDPNNPGYTNSYDLFMRGEEITSGAQRIHDSVFLAKRAEEKGILVETIADYINAFKYGAPCHGGAGFGLERIVKFYCNLHNIRKASLFPRDPQRLTP